MTELEKIGLIEELMELEKGRISKATCLCDIEEWDSVAVISFIALMDDEFGKTIKGDQVRKFETIADVIAVMNDE